MSQVILKAKTRGDPVKYSKVIKWTDNMSTQTKDSRKRITYFDQISRESKGRPGPATYKKEQCLIQRIPSVYYR